MTVFPHFADDPSAYQDSEVRLSGVYLPTSTSEYLRAPISKESTRKGASYAFPLVTTATERITLRVSLRLSLTALHEVYCTSTPLVQSGSKSSSARSASSLPYLDSASTVISAARSKRYGQWFEGEDLPWGEFKDTPKDEVAPVLGGGLPQDMLIMLQELEEIAGTVKGLKTPPRPIPLVLPGTQPIGMSSVDEKPHGYTHYDKGKWPATKVDSIVMRSTPNSPTVDRQKLPVLRKYASQPFLLKSSSIAHIYDRTASEFLIGSSTSSTILEATGYHSNHPSRPRLPHSPMYRPAACSALAASGTFMPDLKAATRTNKSFKFFGVKRRRRQTITGTELADAAGDMTALARVRSQEPTAAVMGEGRHERLVRSLMTKLNHGK